MKRNMHRTKFNECIVLSILLSTAFASVTVRAQQIVYVDANATGANDGSSWGDAYANLQDALTAAVGGEEIRVAAATYTPGSPGDRSATFQLINGVGLYGGYRGCPGGDCASGDPDERNIDVYETRLAGDLDGDDVADLEGFVGCFSGDGNPYGPGCDTFDLDTDGDVDVVDGHVGENAYHVVTGSGADATAVLDGLTIIGGNADGPWQDRHNSGGGMFNDAGSPTLSRCRFIANLADLNSGGMYNFAASPALTDCAFIANRAVSASGIGGGGGMRNEEGSNPILTGCSFIRNRTPQLGGAILNLLTCNPTLTDCVFTDNSGASGGAFANWGGNSTFANCTFTDNSSGGLGGAMDLFEGGATFINCTFEGNTTGFYGGAISTDNNVSLTLIHCTFIGNSCTIEDGGALFLLTFGVATVTNCRFFGNSAVRFGGAVQGAAVQLSMTNCIFSGNSAASGGAYMGWANGTPTLTNCTFTENTATDTAGGVYIIGTGNQTLENCILWNNSDSGGTDESAQIYIDGPGPLVVRYSLIQGLDTLLGDGNIDADPLFIDADGPDDTIGTEDDNLRVQSGSPCIDAADNTAVPPDTVDLDGDGNTTERTPLDLGYNPRFVDDPNSADTGVADPPDYPHIADMGAYEFPGAGEPIPTVSEWGLIVTMLLLLSAGTVVLRARRTATWTSTTLRSFRCCSRAPSRKQEIGPSRAPCGGLRRRRESARRLRNELSMTARRPDSDSTAA